MPDTVHESVQKTLAAPEDQEDKKVKKEWNQKKHTVLIFCGSDGGGIGDVGGSVRFVSME